MDIEYFKDKEPLFGAWYVIDYIDKGGFGHVYEIERRDVPGMSHSALKVITIPKDRSDYKSVMSSGMSEKDTERYFLSIVDEMKNEFAIMDKVKGYTNIVSYEDHIVLKHDNETAWDIMIRMELLTPLGTYREKHVMNDKEVLKLGIDICEALKVCEKYNIIHRDIKTDNIFVSESGAFKLGDFGIAKTIEKTSQASTRVGTKSYAAPEVERGLKYNSQVDIYSLGMVLYKLFNHDRLPFYPPYTESLTHGDVERALERRLSGEQIPVISEKSDAVNAVLRKALAYEVGNRYKHAEELQKDLIRIRESYDEEEKTVVLPENRNKKEAGGERTVRVGKVCPKCGHENAPEAAFCGVCGNKIDHSSIEEKVTFPSDQQVVSSGGNGWKAGVIGILAIIAIALVVLIVCLFMTKTNETRIKPSASADVAISDKEPEPESETESESEPEPSSKPVKKDTDEPVVEQEEQKPEPEPEPEPEKPVQYDSLGFGIDLSTVEDYSRNLDPREYIYYNSQISDFSFCYPAHLFNDVSMDTTSYATNYGKNLGKIVFTGSKGSSLTYSISQRNDTMTTDELSDYVFNMEWGKLYESQEILNRRENGYGKVIVTGYDDVDHKKVVYDMTKIEGDYVLQMILIYPEETSTSDKNQKGYVTECVYKMCGFSDSKKAVQSYSEYLESLNN